jgi:ADP-dependent phosphofructokinase/glucokinase
MDNGYNIGLKHGMIVSEMLKDISDIKNHLEFASIIKTLDGSSITMLLQRIESIESNIKKLINYEDL